MKSIKKPDRLCEKCNSKNIKTHQTTYPVMLGEKQVNIGRVYVRECLDCHHIKPTKAGQEKVDRCAMSVFSFLMCNS